MASNESSRGARGAVGGTEEETKAMSVSKKKEKKKRKRTIDNQSVRQIRGARRVPTPACAQALSVVLKGPQLKQHHGQRRCVTVEEKAVRT